jgi:hypothetical protein
MEETAGNEVIIDPFDVAMKRMEAAEARRTTNKTYRREYTTFLKWVTDNIDDPLLGLVIDDGACFITRSNVDTYFRTVAVQRIGNKNTASRIHQALQWFYTNVENPTGELKVKSIAVESALREQQDHHRIVSTVHSGTDPHKGLKDLLPESDKRTLLRYIYGVRNDSESLGMSFNWGKNAGVRGASSRSCGYADLNLSFGFGPEREAPNNRTLLLILRKGNIHKDNYSMDKQVGCQRHKDYIQCSIFSTALRIVGQLRSNSIINFNHGSRNKRAAWWDTSLIEFETLNDESNAMREVYNGTGVESCKVTHHRTQAVQMAGSEGLAPWQINTFTKHMIEKLHSAYQSEVDKETLKVMSGFHKEETRFVPREHLVLPFDIRQYIDWLLPNYSTWLEQMNSPTGDKSGCCRKFLLSIIPFLVETLVQDGIYFISEFPRHAISEYLKNSIPGYENWTLEARQAVENIRRTRREDVLRALNANLQVVVGSLHEQVESLQRDVRINSEHLFQLTVQSQQKSTTDATAQTSILHWMSTVSRQIGNLTKKVSESTKIQQQQQQQGQQQQQQPQVPLAPNQDRMQRQQQPNNHPPQEQGNGEVGGLAEEEGGRGEEEKDGVEEEGGVEAAGHGLNAFQVLRDTPRQPAIGATFPRTWVGLIEEWEGLSLSSFLGSDQRLWTGSDIKSRFCKRRSAVEEAIRLRGLADVSLTDMAVELDLERIDAEMTLTGHLRYLRANNPQVLRRRPRQLVATQSVATKRQEAARQRQQQPHQPGPPIPRQQPTTRTAAAPVTPMTGITGRPPNIRTTATMTEENRRRIGQAGDRGAAIARAYVRQTPEGNLQLRAADFRRLLANPMDLLEDENVETLENIQHGQI